MSFQNISKHLSKLSTDFYTWWPIEIIFRLIHVTNIFSTLHNSVSYKVASVFLYKLLIKYCIGRERTEFHSIAQDPTLRKTIDSSFNIHWVYISKQLEIQILVFFLGPVFPLSLIDSVSDVTCVSGDNHYDVIWDFCNSQITWFHVKLTFCRFQNPTMHCPTSFQKQSNLSISKFQASFLSFWVSKNYSQ